MEWDLTVLPVMSGEFQVGFGLLRHSAGCGWREFRVFTVRGYSALMRVFLVHSALEQYLNITNQTLYQLEPADRKRQSAKVIARIFDDDKDGRLFAFVHARLNPRLQHQFTRCRNRECFNVGIISSAFRHIFAHGHLSANPNDKKPQRIERTCHEVCTFLIEFIDSDFLERMRKAALRKTLSVKLRRK